MEIEVSLTCTASPVEEIYLRNRLGLTFALTTLKHPGSFCLTEQGSASKVGTIDRSIQNFLARIEAQGIEFSGYSELRVGVYFEAEEALFISVALSSSTIAALAKNRFALDVICYPCD